MEPPEKIAELETSLLGLHASVERLIRLIRENAATLERREEILDKLPLLDFYNDDLLRSIQNLRDKF